ncbi:hypothetical protein NDU88_004146 [Pleurodeles waltl]|uniref:Uncharacterized protein n=1 Tax=Pleurodeles waltl TaxID=8319 RepID=A0AAV7KWW7_PLEWA|nr:hypothetical protein NDU88_004146 [Pleurodeles waltl]
MEITEANGELDIEEIIKTAREAATTSSRDWILKQIKGAGSDEKKLERSTRTTGQPTQQEVRYHPLKQGSDREIQAEARKKGSRERRASPRKLQPRGQARRRIHQMVSKSA